MSARRVPGAIALWAAGSACAAVLAALYFTYAVSLGSLSDPVAKQLARLGPVPAFAADLDAAAATRTLHSGDLAAGIALPDVEVSDVRGGVRIVLKADELFPSGSARLHSRLEPVVLRVAEALERAPGTVLITGHTDDVPIRSARFPSNWELSAERARSVAALMRTKIHDSARLRVEGLADSQPLVPNDTAAHRAKNRRVTIVLKGGGS